jgi:hypothetical protein
MKLIEKIQKAHSNKPTDYSRLYTPTAEIIEQIADDFAIGFAEWCQYRCIQKEDLKSQLEIFKNQKGL